MNSTEAIYNGLKDAEIDFVVSVPCVNLSKLLEMVDEDEEIFEDEEVKIIRTKKFGIKPMYPEDACVQMELLGHNFFVFFNAETEQVNVVYKRKGNTYGLIEPEF